MGKIKRGNHIFVKWIGDHGNHVHVFSDDRLVLKWDIDRKVVLQGLLTSRLREILDQLQREGRI